VALGAPHDNRNGPNSPLYVHSWKSEPSECRQGLASIHRRIVMVIGCRNEGNAIWAGWLVCSLRINWFTTGRVCFRCGLARPIRWSRPDGRRGQFLRVLICCRSLVTGRQRFPTVAPHPVTDREAADPGAHRFDTSHQIATDDEREWMCDWYAPERTTRST
jgi:hypothetical protein